jgi:hypothetical protein
MQTAGNDWLWGFIKRTKRNSSISLRKPEKTTINRILAFNKDEVSIPILHKSGNYTGKIQIQRPKTS